MLLVWSHKASAELTEDVVKSGRFGNIHIYHATPQPKQVVLFISDDAGWKLDVIGIAKALANLDALVVGIDINSYLKQLAVSNSACNYPASDFEALSQYLQKRYHYSDYVEPVLVGYSSGAALVYTTLAQSPPNIFRGGISLGFCPDLPLNKPLCRGSALKSSTLPNGKGYEFLPTDLQTPWIAFQADIDQVCDAKMVDKFISQTGNTSVVSQPKAGHDFSVQRLWMPQLKDSFNRLITDIQSQQSTRPDELKHLPLVEVQAKNPGKTFAVIVSGDGGWASIDKSLAVALALKGVPSVGLDSLHYFWTKRTPDETGQTLQEILQHYFSAWQMDKVLLIGYSRGADVLPFMASRLPKKLLDKTSLIALLGAEHNASFEFRVEDLLPGSVLNAPYQVKPEVEKLTDTNLLCIYGSDEVDSLCPDLDAQKFHLKKLSGSHHFGGDYQALAEKLLLAVH